MKKWIPIAILVLAFVVRAGLAVYYPQALTDDEKAHWAYAKYIAVEGELPYWASSKTYIETDQAGVYWYENYQQPGFYVAAAPFAEWGVVPARLFSLALWFGGVVLLWSICRQWWMLLFLILPGSIIVTSMVTNQSLEFFGACVLAYGIHEDSSWVIGFGGLLFALAKVTGIAVCIALVALYVYRREMRWLWLMPAVVIGLALFYERFPLFGVNSTLLMYPADIMRNLGHSLTTGILDPMQPKSMWLTIPGIGIFFTLIWAIKRYWRWLFFNEYGLCVATLSGIMIWFLTFHTFGEGRLMYAALPFLLVNAPQPTEAS